MDQERIRELSAREAERFAARTPTSKAMFERAQRVLAGGVSSSFHGREPWPVYLTRGDGARVWDADGNEYVDFHNGFSAMVQGHAHPVLVHERGAVAVDAVAVAPGTGP
jgi:glutamate-1-semialdehyde 2,1-aminomutase